MYSRSTYRGAACHALIALLLLAGLTLAGCEQTPSNDTPVESPAHMAATEKEHQHDNRQDRQPPAPPITESFDAAPQLSLFPRAGDFRPEEDNDRLPFWMTFIDHLIKTSGPLTVDQEAGQHAWGLRGIKSIDSVGFFSPLAVEPATAYQVSLRIKTDLADGASAGVGILEFSEFLWIADQFTEEQVKQFGTGTQEGIRVTGTHDWQTLSFEFTTGPDTHMIHLILFREGASDRNPVLFDDIVIEPVQKTTSATTNPGK